MEELKPCPFCGGEAYANWWAGYAHGECEECGACGEDVKPHENETMEQTEARAIKAWNTRAERTCKMTSLMSVGRTDFVCDQCDHCTCYTKPNFCPTCGAKVVDE